MISPGPAMTFVFVDEREDTIHDGAFQVDMWNEPPFLPSSPRSSHHGAELRCASNSRISEPSFLVKGGTSSRFFTSMLFFSVFFPISNCHAHANINSEFVNRAITA